ncbi:MAG: OmpA family protein [Elusimicrobia bacterium]|nr:OmpA family protein [Elusimicrobiota bacterium]
MRKTVKILLAIFFFLSVNVFSYAAKEELFFIDGKDFVSVSVDRKIFSPNNDGSFDTVTFGISLLQKNLKIKNWQLDIVNAQTKEVVYSFFGEKEIPKKLVWDGKNKKDKIVEGNYKYVFTASVNKRNIKIEQQDDFVLDVTVPYVSFSSSLDTVLLDKEKNSFVNNVLFVFNVGDESEIDKSKTKIQIYSFKNQVIKEWSFDKFNEIPQSVSWDGKDDVYDLLVPAGEYKVVFTVSDIVNNKIILYTNITTFEQVVGKISEIVVKEEPRGLVVNLSNSILFDAREIELKKEAKDSLDEMIKLLNAYPANKVLIEGYSDSNGDEEENLKLSYDRAQEVYLYFVKNGIPAERLTVVGFGQENPIASNKTAKGRAQNRRVKIVILKSQNEEDKDSADSDESQDNTDESNEQDKNKE